MNKFRNHRTLSFDSKIEQKRYLVLLQAERDGVVRNIRRQVKYELIPKQVERIEMQMKTKTKIVERVVEHPVCYLADFVYWKRNGDDWEEVIEDVKSKMTRTLPEYIIKRKLMRLQGHPIKEVLKATAEI